HRHSRELPRRSACRSSRYRPGSLHPGALGRPLPGDCEAREASIHRTREPRITRHQVALATLVLVHTFDVPHAGWLLRTCKGTTHLYLRKGNRRLELGQAVGPDIAQAGLLGRRPFHNRATLLKDRGQILDRLGGCGVDCYFVTAGLYSINSNVVEHEREVLNAVRVWSLVLHTAGHGVTWMNRHAGDTLRRVALARNESFHFPNREIECSGHGVPMYIPVTLGVCADLR